MWKIATFRQKRTNFSNNKSPGNDGLTKEFHETFLEDLKQPSINSLN